MSKVGDDRSWVVSTVDPESGARVASESLSYSQARSALTGWRLRRVQGLLSTPQPVGRVLSSWMASSGGSEADSDPALRRARHELEGEFERIRLATALALCGLPYSPTAERQTTRRARTGRNRWLSVTYTSTSADPGVPLPYGADRLLLAWIVNLAYRSGSPVVEFDRVTEFLNTFSIRTSGADYRIFRERLARLEALHITIATRNEMETKRLELHPILASSMPLARELRGSSAVSLVQGELPFPLPVEPMPRIRTRYGLYLDPNFYEYLRHNTIPVPLPILRLYKDKPKLLDFVVSLLYRCFSAKKPSVIPWADLQEQLGFADSHERRQKMHFARALDDVRKLYPSFPAVFAARGRDLEVEPWRPPEN